MRTNPEKVNMFDSRRFSSGVNAPCERRSKAMTMPEKPASATETSANTINVSCGSGILLELSNGLFCCR